MAAALRMLCQAFDLAAKTRGLRRTCAAVERRARYRSFMAYRHQDNRGEQDPERFQAGIDLAEGHAQQCADNGGGSDRERHDGVPATRGGTSSGLTADPTVLFPIPNRRPRPA